MAVLALTFRRSALTAAAVVRPAIADHLATIIAEAPPGGIDVCGLTRNGHLDALFVFRPGWAGLRPTPQPTPLPLVDQF